MIANLGYVRDTLLMALTWIDNLVDRVGLEVVLDCLPNNTGGRKQIKAALAMLGYRVEGD